jgi:hypothetical protein
MAAPSLTAPDVASSAPARRPGAFALDLSTSAGVGSYASGAGAVARAGGGAALAHRSGLRPALGVSAYYVFPFEVGSRVATANVGIAALRSTAAIEVYGSTSFAIDLAAGGGVDVLRVDPSSRVLPADRLGSSETRVSPVAVAAATGHLALGTGVSLSLTVAADVDLASRRWVLETDDGQRGDAFVPARVRPLALLGFTFTALGASRFAAREVAR